MLSQADKEILCNKNFQRLVAVRRWVAWSFLLLLLGLYLAFGLLSVYSPAFLARPVFADGVVPFGVIMGYGILATTFMCGLRIVFLNRSSKKSLLRLTDETPTEAHCVAPLAGCR